MGSEISEREREREEREDEECLTNREMFKRVSGEGREGERTQGERGERGVSTSIATMLEEGVEREREREGRERERERKRRASHAWRVVHSMLPNERERERQASSVDCSSSVEGIKRERERER